MFTYLESTVRSIDDWSLTLEEGTAFCLDRKYGVVPKVGDTIRVKLHQQTVAGVWVNGNLLFDKSAEELTREQDDFRLEQEIKQRAAYQIDREKLDADYAALLPVFQRRIDKFRSTNPDFRWKYECYEMFCCQQAIIIAATLKIPAAIEEFYKLSCDKRKKAVPGLDDEHSGNTFGMAVLLAVAYLKDPETVVAAHGALVPIVGCEDYGCPHLADSARRGTESRSQV